ncbi:hypothetical protein GSI_05518 [Ganoderma sinense ZZ0214-1]|uniref:Uncharacterized protein n=1 Tax=Ganoderma sinense ZZ0214-1 TaxID=1077348 RepID=A0A2G8SEU0_9APHY|nr:hypothetical protein GSI_05518 [Ganoderma sinense ZZ0214-1]
MVADLRPALAFLSAHASGRAVSPPGTPVVPSLDTTFGAITIGTFVGLALCGHSLNQATHYFRKYTKDPLIIKCIIGFLVVLNMFHSIGCMHASYHYGVTNFFKPRKLYYDAWSIQVKFIAQSLILTPISGIMMLIAQGHILLHDDIFTFVHFPDSFVHGTYWGGPQLDVDTYTSSSRWPCPWRQLLVLPLVGRLIPSGSSSSDSGNVALPAAASGEIFMLDTFSQVKHYTWLISAALACALATDVILCVTLLVSLISSGSVVWRKHSVLTIFLVCTVNTVDDHLTKPTTSALTLLSLIFSVIYWNNFVFVAVSMLATKSYVNIVLAVVNSRRIHVQSTSQTAAFGSFGLTAQVHSSHRNALRGGVLPTPRKDVLERQRRIPSAVGDSDGDGNMLGGMDKGRSWGCTPECDSA